MSEDLISRQAAIEAVGFNSWAGMRLQKVPSAVVRCRNCKHWLQIVENSKHGACDQWCTLNVTTSHDYCSRAERRTE